MDLSNLRVTDTPEKLYFDHPFTGETMDGEEDMVFHVISMNSAPAMEVRRKLQTKWLKKAGKGIYDRSAEESIAQENELLATCVQNWENVVFEGEELSFSKANVKKLLADPGLHWVKEQLQSFVESDRNFMKKA